MPAQGGKVSKKKVFLVDDHEIVRRGLRLLIEDEGDLKICGEAADGVSALSSILAAKPDVAVVDLGLEEGTGLDLIRTLRSRLPNLPVLVVSMYEESLYAERAFHDGAKGYLMKKDTANKVVPALRQVLSGKMYMSPLLAEKLLGRLARGGDPGATPVETLSDRELEVFTLIGAGLKTSEIAGKLHLSTKTIASYRDQVKVKLSLDTAADLTRCAIEWAHDHRCC